MSARDSFTVYLRDLPAREVKFHTADDGRHILDITGDIQLYVRPAEDDLPAVIAGLRKLAAAAGEMAAALTGFPRAEADGPQAEPDPAEVARLTRETLEQLAQSRTAFIRERAALALEADGLRDGAK